MTPEKQRIAIAEACGWSDVKKHDSFITGYKPGTDCKSDWRRWHLPIYLNDLNAMHEAEETLNGSFAPNEVSAIDEYQAQLTHICGGQYWKYCHATAAQRAEAFLRTIGKWEDAQP